MCRWFIRRDSLRVSVAHEKIVTNPEDCVFCGIMENASQRVKVSFWAAASIVAANMIGTGVFTSLGFQLLGLHNAFSILMLWVLGGILAACGALCYGELAGRLPGNGGEYFYLSRIYHPAFGFVTAWISMTVGFAAPIAAASMAFSRYFGNLMTLSEAGQQSVATAVILLMVAVHWFSVKQGSRFQVISTLVKVTLILGFILAGAFAGTQAVDWMPGPDTVTELTGMAFAGSLVYVMYAYSGWNAATYIADEVERPQINVPRALLLGTLAVMVLYVLIHVMFLHAAPMELLAGQLDVGHVAATTALGDAWAGIMNAIITLALVSTISAMTWAGPRVTASLGKDIPAFRQLAATNEGGVPRMALLLQTGIALLLLFTSSFDLLISTVGILLTLSAILTVAGVFVLRIRQGAPTGARAWGYPLTPLLFILVCGWMIAFALMGKPDAAWISGGVLAAGTVLYFLTSRNKSQP